MMNPADLFKIKGYWDTFTNNHPKFPAFLRAAGSKGVETGTVVTIKLDYPDGTSLETNLKVTDSDKELFAAIMSMNQ